MQLLFGICWVYMNQGLYESGSVTTEAYLQKRIYLF